MPKMSQIFEITNLVVDEDKNLVTENPTSADNCQTTSEPDQSIDESKLVSIIQHDKSRLTVLENHLQKISERVDEYTKSSFKDKGKCYHSFQKTTDINIYEEFTHSGMALRESLNMQEIREKVGIHGFEENSSEVRDQTATYRQQDYATDSPTNKD